ncbi:MAG TPA: tetratricopeptide repeat protein, partial [Methylotenera sp.]|nr:tetratricopeptide repeat protein [Methylotenera sp.]HPN01931.1 tetratricopeptide repeat protein [Methylotenera sp.]
VSAPDKRLAYVLALLIPLSALGVYHKIGSPVHVFNPEATVARSEYAHDKSVMSADFETLLNQLKAKLEQEPNNADGWALLARSYVQLGRHAEAVTAYEQAANLIQDDPSLLADYADALGVVNGGSLVGKPESMINQALKLDPHHDKALMLAGTVAYDKKDYTNAISLWERLKKVLSPQSELLPDVNAALAETYSLAGIKPPVIQSQEEVNKPFAVSSASINGAVTMAPELANKVSPTDTVFIFARPARGKTMPLAIEKISARELPYNFMLDDSKALIPNHKLSQASEVILVARVSKTGDATSNPGDLEGVSALVKPNGTTVNIEIKNIVE